MKTLLKKTALLATFAFATILFFGCTVETYTPATSYNYISNNPSWAPTYYTGTRYYYFPDIEAFYDLRSNMFVILSNGRWDYVNSLSSYYPYFDLSTSYIVVLNNNVYNPWLHSQYYVSHYPRYYYRDYYDYSNIPYVRGYNENKKSAIYWAEKDRDKARSWDNRYIKKSKNFKYSAEDKKMQEETTRNNQNRQTYSTSNGRNTSNTNNGRNTVNNNNNNNNNTNQYNNKNVSNNTHYNNNNSGTTNNNSQNRNTYNNQNIGNTNNNKNSQTNNTNTRTSNNTATTDKSSDTNYRGNQIGRPVRVSKDMQKTENTSSRSTTTRSSSTTSNRTRSQSDNNTTTRSSSRDRN